MSAIKKTDLAHFFRTYYRYQRAGVTTQEFLHMYYNACSNKEFLSIIEVVQKDMRLGASFSEALRKHPVFPQYVVQMIAVGEISSMVVPILEKIVFFLIQENDIEKKVNASVRQGIIMIVIALIGSFITLVMVIPKIGEILLTVRPELPFFTSIVVGFSTFLQEHVAYLGVGMLLVIVMFFYLKKAKPEILDMWHLKLPIFGPILKTQIHSYFFSVIGICTMVDNITIQQAITYASRTIKHIPTQQTLFNAVRYMKSDGLRAYEAIRKADVHHIFDDELYIMMEAGEKSGFLHEILEEEGKEYQKMLVRQAEEIGDKLSTSIIIPAISALVLLLMSVYYPIFELVGSAQNIR